MATESIFLHNIKIEIYENFLTFTIIYAKKKIVLFSFAFIINRVLDKRSMVKLTQLIIQPKPMNYKQSLRNR